MYPKFLLTVIATFLLFWGALALPEPTLVARQTQAVTALPGPQDTGTPEIATASTAAPPSATNAAFRSGGGSTPSYFHILVTNNQCYSWNLYCFARCCYIPDGIWEYIFSASTPYSPPNVRLYQSRNCRGNYITIDKRGYYDISNYKWKSISRA